MKKLLLLAACLGFAAPVWACDRSPRGDTNGDQVSDVIVADVNRSAADYFQGATDFYVLQSPFTTDAVKVSFNRPFDAMFAADWDGDCNVEPTGVRVVPTTGRLEWSYKPVSGSLSRFRFGTNGDKPHAGNIQSASDDPDGRADAIVSRTCPIDDSKACWYFRLSTTEAESGPIEFGNADDELFVSDVDDDGIVELVAVDTNRTPKMRWQIRRFSDGRVTSKVFGTRGEAPLAPTDFNGDDLIDYAVISSTAVARQVTIDYGGSQPNRTFRVGRKNHIPMVGVFESGARPNVAWFRPERGSLTYRRPSGASRSLPRVAREKDLFIVRPQDQTVDKDENGLGAADVVQCDIEETIGFGDTWKPSDTRSCIGFSSAFGKSAFIPNLPQRRAVSNWSPCDYYLARVVRSEIIDEDGTVIAVGVQRPGCPNGRFTVDYCPGPAEIENRFGSVYVRHLYNDGRYECIFLPQPNKTYRNSPTPQDNRQQ